MTEYAANQFDAVVVGAGPAGAAMAAGLAGEGWRVALVERSRLPRHKVCGEFLSPESQNTLAALGLFDALVRLAPAPLASATLASRRNVTLEMPLPGRAWGLSRYAMDQRLAAEAAARGATLLMETTALRAEHDAAGVKVHVRTRKGAEALRARTLLMAGGRQSSAHLPPWPSTRQRHRLFVGVKVHLRDVIMPQRVELFLFDGGYVGVNPVESGAVNVCLLARYADFARAGGTPASMLASIAAENLAFAARVEGGALLPESVCTVAGVDTDRPAQPWLDMPCLGDTATMIPPLCGDGMAMALRSAEICLPLAHDYLRGAATLDSWRRRYEAAWHCEFDRRLRLGRTLQRVLSLPPVADAAIAAGRLAPRLADYAVRATRGPVAASSTSG